VLPKTFGRIKRKKQGKGRCGKKESERKREGGKEIKKGKKKER